MDSLFDDYDVSKEDASQIKKDNVNHKYTSWDNLNTYAKSLRAAGNYISDAAKKEAQDWLVENASDLPSELYDKDGLPRHAKDEWSFSSLGEDEVPELSTDDDDLIGLFYVGNASGCYQSLESILLDPKRPESASAYKSEGMTDALYIEAMTIRGERYARHLADQRKKARWLGMEEWNAVKKGDEYLRAGGAKLSVGAESAIDLPPVERLRQLFTVANGQLVWAVARRGVAKGKVVTGKQVQVEGRFYVTKRIHYKLVHGVDPKSAAVADDLTARDYRSVGASYESERKTVDNRFEATARIKGKLIKVGTYSTQEKADAASSIFLRSVERGI